MPRQILQSKSGIFGEKFNEGIRKKDFLPAKAIHRNKSINEKWRLSGLVDYFLLQNWQRINAVSGNSGHSNATLRLNLTGIYSLSPNWSVSAGFSQSQYWEKDNGSAPVQNDASNALGIGLEYSFLPYKDYFRKRFVLGYTWSTSVSSGQKIETPDIFLRNHQIYGEYAKIGPWGFMVAGVGSNLDYNPYQWLRYSFNSSIELGVNLGKNIYTTFEVAGFWDENKYDFAPPGQLVVQIRNMHTAFVGYSMGVKYYFGSGYRNVVYPRFYTEGQYF